MDHPGFHLSSEHRSQSNKQQALAFGPAVAPLSVIATVNRYGNLSQTAADSGTGCAETPYQRDL
jgi:hypothetical protein